MNAQIQAMRETRIYEYQIYSTPRYIGDQIDESWEIHKVFHSYLENWAHNFIVVLRRPWTAGKITGIKE